MDSLIQWSQDDDALAKWVLSLKPADLPEEPWQISPCEIITENARYLASIQRECKIAPRGVRVKMGTLQAELKRLYRAVTGNDA